MWLLFILFSLYLTYYKVISSNTSIYLPYDHHIRYARKSKWKGDDEACVCLLQDMTSRFRNRNLTDSAYVSFCSSISEIICSRDACEEYRTMALSAINEYLISNVASGNLRRHNPNDTPFKHKAWTQILKQQKNEAFYLPVDTSDTVFLEGIDPYSIIISTSQFVGMNFKAKSLKK